MSENVSVPHSAPPSGQIGFGGAKLQTSLGRWGVAVAALAAVFTVSLPFITMAYRDTYPVTDTWVMPVMALIAVDAAAIVNVLAIVWKKERSLTSLIVTAAIGLAGVYVTLMVVGEGLAGV